jgi:hypothetical protein
VKDDKEYQDIEWMWNHVLDTRDMLGQESAYSPEFLSAMKAFYFLGAFGYAVCQKEIANQSMKKGLSMQETSILINKLFTDTERLSAESILQVPQCESSTTSRSP